MGEVQPAPSRPRLQAGRIRPRFLGWVLLLANLLVLSAAVIFGWQAWLRLGELQDQARAARSTAASLHQLGIRDPRALSTRLARAQADLTSLRSSLSRADPLADVGEVWSAAGGAGLTVQSLQVGTPKAVRGFSELPLTVQLTGSPAGLLAFIRTVEHGPRLATVSLPTLPLSGAKVSVAVRVSFFSRGGKA